MSRALLAGMLFTLTLACAQSGDRGLARQQVPDPTPRVDVATLCDRLRAYASAPDIVLTNGNAFACGLQPAALTIAWVSTDSMVGEGIVGVFDGAGELQSWRRTRPIVRCTPVEIRGIGEVVLCVEAATGTGLYLETLHLIEPRRLQNDLWHGDVSLWEEGCEGRNIGQRADHNVVLMDMDSDGVEEVVDFALVRRGTDPQEMLLLPPAVRCAIYAFDPASQRFEAWNAPSTLRSVYPSRQE